MRACAASASGEMVCAIIKKPAGLEADLAGEGEVLFGDVGFGAVRRDSHDRHADLVDGLDVVLGAEPGQHQRGDLGVGGGLDSRLHQDAFVDERLAVVVRRSAEPVAVGDFDDRHACVVDGGDDVTDVLLGELVPFGVGAVAQAGVGDADVEGVGEGAWECSGEIHQAGAFWRSWLE